MIFVDRKIELEDVCSEAVEVPIADFFMKTLNINLVDPLVQIHGRSIILSFTVAKGICFDLELFTIS